jgi:acetyl/propionyl-CoA carboxylase alpha subunit
MARVIKRILIANRGEIACRIERTARRMGIETVALYTDEEKALPHVRGATQAVCLGTGPLSETYLNQQRLIDIAKQTKCEAIHPGYGFLSENASFARATELAGLIFIGPSPEVIELMGDKKGSKVKMGELKVPLIPGYHSDEQDSNALEKAAKTIGFPLLIKASAGGGGKGMRIVRNASEFLENLEGAKREAMNAFGDDRVLLEKFLENPRHIEIQVLSDTHGHHLFLHERECSIQRRYQKVIEEAPSTAVSETLRAEMGKTAVAITKGLNYRGAGTLEFMLDEDGKFYFLEMNTRLQVEHPVTEMITGLDLVEWQIRIARGEPLSFTQGQVPLHGHALEVRLYAEDPDNEFLPCTGELKAFNKPTQAHTRLDTGYENGQQVTTSFDPMIAKLITWGPDREAARVLMIESLKEVGPLGLTTNQEFLIRLLEHPEFIKAQTTTKFISAHENELKSAELTFDLVAQALGAKLLGLDRVSAQAQTQSTSGVAQAWESLGGFRLNGDLP